MQTGKIKLLKTGYTEVLYAMGSSVNEWDYFYSVDLQCISWDFYSINSSSI